MIDRDAITDPLEIERLMLAHPDCVLLIDAGGVLFNNVIEQSTFLPAIAAEFGVDAERLGFLYRNGDNRFEKNEICAREFLRDCLMMLGVNELDSDALDVIDTLYIRSVTVDETLFLVLERLRSMDLTVVLANNEGERWETLKDRHFGHLSLFKAIASSWKLRACKPETEYFCRLQQMLYPVPKTRWWFVDDNENVVAAARANAIAASRYSKTGSG